MEYFLDTSYLVAITNKSDQYHNKAIKVRNTLIEPIRLITTQAVLMEYGNLLSKMKTREKAFNYIQHLKEDENTEIVIINSKLFDKGLDIFGKYKDKEWGLVDCISFVLMRERSILQALTSDEHFEQAGFNVLLKSF